MSTNHIEHRQFCRKSALAMITLILTLTVFGTFMLKPQVRADTNLPPITLTIVALNGTQVVLHETDIETMASFRAYGGYVKSSGTIGGLGNYTGVPISTLLDIVGGITSGYSVQVIATDNYSKTLSYENLNGTGLLTFDNVTGKPVQANQTLTPMLAYYFDDANLTSGGPLRLAIVGPEGLLTQSSLWVSNVVTLEIHPNLQPMNLTLVGPDGSSMMLNQTTISNLPAVTAVGGFRNKLGIVKNLGNYTGPTLNTLCDLVGGITNNMVVRIIAVDNYLQTFSYDMVNGAFTTYDPSTGNPVQANQSLIPILAYYFNGANLTAGVDGPLRLAIVGPEGLATTSSLWVSQVVEMDVRYIDDMAVTNVAPQTNVVVVSSSCNVNVTVANEGGYTETFNVTLNANSSAIGFSQNMVLANNSVATIDYVWNTTNFALGNYTLWAYIPAVPYETNTANNNFTYGPVEIRGIDDVAVTQITPSKTVIGKGFICPVSVIVSNLGNYSETFTVTVYANQTLIGMENVSVDAQDSMGLLFEWNTTNSIFGNFTLSASASQVPFETNVQNNNLTDGSVYVGLAGDFNLDHRVDIRDIAIIAKAFGSMVGDARYSPNVDLNGDGRIDMRDLSIAAQNFGEAY